MSKGFKFPDEMIDRWMDSVEDSMSGVQNNLRVTVGDRLTIIEASDAIDKFKIWYVFDDVTERDAFFAAYPELLNEDTLIAIKDTSPPPTPGTRSLDFSIPYNSQYFILLYP